MNTFEQEINNVARLNIADQTTQDRFVSRLKEEGYTRDENPVTHYCIYFLPYNLQLKKVFLAHHKKSGLWIFPGGHIDKGENLMQGLTREAREELGLVNKIDPDIKPFLLTITPMNDPKRACKEHLDIWYRLPIQDSDLNVDPSEFHATLWCTLSEARDRVTDKPNLLALDLMEKLFTDSSK